MWGRFGERAPRTFLIASSDMLAVFGKVKPKRLWDVGCKGFGV